MKNGYRSADEAEQAFYNAIEQKDIGLMSDLWLDDDSIVCIHPMGARLQGRQQVLGSWQEIFRSDSSLLFSLQEITSQQSNNLSVHVLHEVITPSTSPEKPTVVIATNIYQQNETGLWQMVLHHASLSPKTVTERTSDKQAGTRLH